MEYISEDDAWKFITGKLKLTEAKSTMKENKLLLLHNISQSFLNTIPFHNVAFLNGRPENGKTPSLLQNIEWVTSGFGGLCWTMNSAMFCILKAIGYEAFPVLASAGIRDINDHAVTVVKNVQVPGDTFLVDVGFGSPGFHPLCLDFEQESQQLEESFWVYKIVKQEDLYIRMGYSRYKNESSNDTVEKPWKEEYYFKLVPCPLDELTDWMHRRVYTYPNIIFYKSLRVNVFQNNRMIAIKDDTLLVENSEHKLEPTHLASDEEILMMIRKYFPQIPEDLTSNAIKAWRKVEAKTL